MLSCEDCDVYQFDISMGRQAVGRSGVKHRWGLLLFVVHYVSYDGVEWRSGVLKGGRELVLRTILAIGISVCLWKKWIL
jgi:hypothetical protein